MHCFGCHRPKTLGEQSFGFINFGIVGKPNDSEEATDSAQLEDLAERYISTLVFGWRQGDWMYGVDFDEDHENGPQPPLVPLCSEYYFCSLDCMRSWLMRAVDDLEEQVGRKSGGSSDAL